MRKIFDISLGINPDFPVWPGDPDLELERVSKIESGDDANVSRISMSVHCGTHVDAPFHFVENGITIEKLSLDILIGEVLVIEIPEEINQITADVLSLYKIEKKVKRILFKTKNSCYWNEEKPNFHKDFVSLSEDGAAFLVSHGIKLVGIDYFSIASFWDGVPTHNILLKAGIIILEAVDLRKVEAGNYQLICLPLKLVGSDGAPTRCVLVKDD